MTDASVPSPDTPQQVLAGLGDLTRRVRSAQRGAWFPLLLLGALTLGGILVSRFTFKVETVPCTATDPAAGTGCTLVTQGSPVYWPIGLALAYAATAFFYIRRSRNRGVGTPVRPYILTGIVLVGLVTATAIWSLRHGMPQPGEQLDFWGLRLDPTSGVAMFLHRLAGNAAAVGLPLLVLSWVERSRALLLLTAVYLAIELVPLTTGWSGIPFTSPWSAVPRFGVPGVLLLLGALGFGLAELSRRRDVS
ncbi:hypothetical protein GCM10010193_07730 [Kitasatospora atroaurantiaca]|uniref:DUF998 domain-containing protein n=1 Tax=Kitasatospora atroaurantiaca TaxID=285545 RepID=A0A561EJF6_9ACTN|nr:hypothetical protein [Kitasatospora atroaurantiaca]TWE15733.1 hypothetical protein FB465_0660 [Kitasatospora atroaurantiaca]